MITVALIDDHLIVRSGFAQLLGLEPDLQVVAEFGSGREALAGLPDGELPPSFPYPYRPAEDEEPKPQASFSKAVDDLLFGAHSPAAEDKRDLPLTDQTK